MCDFISWIKTGDSILFLTDAEVFSEIGREKLTGTRDNDILGHGAIKVFYGDATYFGQEFENRDFWNKRNYPADIAQYLGSPQPLLQTWGNMLKKALQPDDVFYILKHAPQEWIKSLEDILIGAISNNPRYSCRALCECEHLTESQKNFLVKVVSGDLEYSYITLRECRNLTGDQKNFLINVLSQNAEYSYNILCYCRGLTEDQKDTLIKTCISVSTWYSYGVLLQCRGLTEGQKRMLTLNKK